MVEFAFSLQNDITSHALYTFYLKQTVKYWIDAQYVDNNICSCQHIISMIVSILDLPCLGFRILYTTKMIVSFMIWCKMKQMFDT